MWSGGSRASASLIYLASVVNGQSVDSGRRRVITSVIDEPGQPLTLKACGETLGHSIVNEVPLAFTASLKVTVTLLPELTAVAPFAGLVLVTDGALSVVNEKL